MSIQHNSLKGFIKTENAIFLIVVGLAVGFVSGIVFSAYRSTGQPGFSGPNAPNGSSVPLSAQQIDTQAAMIKQTQEHPEDPDAWAQLGHFYFDTSQVVKAIQAYQTSLRLDDTRPDVWTDLGVMYRRSGNPQMAIQSFDRALVLNPEHEIATFNKGVVLMHDIQDTEGAIAAWKKLVQINPEARTPNGILVKEMVEELEKTDQD